MTNFTNGIYAGRIGTHWLYYGGRIMAERLYYEFIDMDFMDYEEQYESDIAFINGLIDALGDTGARDFLREYTSQ